MAHSTFSKKGAQRQRRWYFMYWEVASQLRLRRLQVGHQHVPHIARRLAEIEAHPLGAEVLAHDVELDPVSSQISTHSSTPLPPL